MERPQVRVGFGAMLIRKGQVLLGQRHPDPEKARSLLQGAGQWTFPGGKLRFGEYFEEAVCREVLEETGLHVDPKDPQLVSVTNNIVEQAHFVTLGFLVTSFVGEASVTEPDEIFRWDWFHMDALPAPLYRPTAQIIERFKANSIYIPDQSRRLTAER